MAYDLGGTVPLTTEIYDADGALTAASAVVCTITQPDGTTVTPSVSNPSTGLYTVDFVPTLAGRHLERWTATSPTTARSDSFDVRPASPAYIISLADAKLHLNKTGDADDDELRTWLEVTTEIVDELSGRATARRTVTERITVRGCGDFVKLTWAPVLSLTSVASIDGLRTWNVDNLDVDPTTGIVRVLSGVPLIGVLQVVYVAGYESVPARLTGAARIVLRHLWESQRSAAGRGRRQGVVNDEMALVAGYAVPRAAADLIGPRGPLV